MAHLDGASGHARCQILSLTLLIVLSLSFSLSLSLSLCVCVCVCDLPRLLEQSQGEARVDSTFFAVEDLAIGEANPQIYTAPSMLLILPYRSLFGTLSFMRRLRPSRYFHSKTRCTSISRLQSGKRPHGLKVCPKTPAYRFQYG